MLLTNLSLIKLCKLTTENAQHRENFIRNSNLSNFETSDAFILCFILTIVLSLVHFHWLPKKGIPHVINGFNSYESDSAVNKALLGFQCNGILPAEHIIHCMVVGIYGSFSIAKQKI